MTRVTPRLLLAIGASLLVAWVVVPLSSSPPPQTAAPTTASATSPLPIPPELDAINREVERLRERLAAPVSETTPTRDPFQFTAPPVERFTGRRPADDRFAPIPEPERPAIAWPSLVAILSSGPDAAPARQAVFEDASELVQLRSVGEAIGDIVVTEIAADEVTLTHAPTGESTRVMLN